MHGAHPAGLREGDVFAGAGEGFVVSVGGCSGYGAALFEAGPEDEEADGEEGSGDQVEAAEEVFDLGLRGVGEGEPGDDFLQRVANDRCQCRRPYSADGEALEGVGGGKVGATSTVVQK